MKGYWEVQSHSLLVVIVPMNPRGAREPEQSAGCTPECQEDCSRCQAHQGQPGAEMGGRCVPFKHVHMSTTTLDLKDQSWSQRSNAGFTNGQVKGKMGRLCKDFFVPREFKLYMSPSSLLSMLVHFHTPGHLLET